MSTGTDTLTFSDEAVLSKLREVVAEKPDYAYSSPEYMQEDANDDSCFYVHKDEDGTIVSPGCAIGVVLHRLGMPLEELVRHEGKTAYQLVNVAVPGISTKTRDTLNRMQMHQDNGETWGESYVKATGETL
ncbi:hypothetical protein ACQEVY_25570 [Streptomyces sp. CA-288835]|uniref:hypothetical protein n=1 Tax=Streptomyces sp. CA-288835 TaxID=3240069 RepID=UPI003D91666B